MSFHRDYRNLYNIIVNEINYPILGIDSSTPLPCTIAFQWFYLSCSTPGMLLNLRQQR